MPDTRPNGEVRLAGLAISNGIAVARACLFNEHRHSNLPIYRITGAGIAREHARVERAVALAKQRLDEIVAKVFSSIGPAEAAIFEAQWMILDDSGLAKRIAGYIDEHNLNAEAAVIRTLDFFESRLLEVDDEYLSERASDIGEVKRRLLDVLGNVNPSLQCTDQGRCQRGRDRIIVAELLTPSLTVDLDPVGVKGFVTEHGGSTSHAAILARSLGIPAVSGIPEIHSRLSCGTELLIDGEKGEIVVWPNPETISSARLSISVESEAHIRIGPVPGFTVMANIGLAQEALDAKRTGADGIGLYRTELELFRAKRQLGEDEQLERYKVVLDAFPNKPVYFRLFDLGGDKTASFLDLPQERNPHLGLRGSRLLLARPALWRAQARALARASAWAFQPVSVLYPMVTDPEQFAEIKRAFAEMIRDIPGSKILHGVMIEVPAACMQAREIFAIADFASVGTNDLIQYLYAVDRDNELVAGNYSLNSPVLWSLLEQVTRAARDTGRPLSVCGEVAADGRYAKKLIAAGVSSVSVAPRLVSAVRAEARKQLHLHEHQSRRSSQPSMEGRARA